MKTVEFKDRDGQDIKIQHSSLATQEAYRIYISGEDVEEKDDGLGNKIPVAMHLTRNQAELLIHGLKDLFSDNEEA